MLEIIIYTLFVGVLGTGFGGVVGSLFQNDSKRTMSLLLSFAGGIMVSIVSFDLIPSSLKNSNVYITVIVTGLGVLLIALLNKIIDIITAKRNDHLTPDHPKTHDDIDELIHSDTFTKEMHNEASRLSLLKAGILMVFAIALHNLPEGLSIGSSFSLDKETGIILAILIALHNIPEGMAIVVPLICGGMKRSKAIALTALSGSPTIIGAVLGYWIGGLSSLGLAISLSIASGAMVYIVFGEVLPQSILMYRSKLPAFFVIFGFLLGLLLVSTI